MKLLLKNYYIYFALILLFIIVQALFVGKIAGTGSKFDDIDTRIFSLEEENGSLEKEIAMQSSLIILSKNNSNILLSELFKNANTHENGDLEMAFKSQ